jgi:hypothetical protein
MSVRAAGEAISNELGRLAAWKENALPGRKGVLMRHSMSLVSLLLLISCSPIGAVETAAVATARVIPTDTSLPPTTSPALTATAEILCDPFTADFCITEGHFIFQRPIQPPANDLIDTSYQYGSTANGTREPHHGVEFPNASGTPVYAAGEGMVIFAGADNSALYSPWQNFYGNLLVIEHEDDLFTLYAHLSQISVAAGQKVFAGEKIGEVGRTGVAIGSHLHFEVRRGNGADYFATQNPELWLIPANDANRNPFGALTISLVDQNHGLIRHAEFTIKHHPDRSEPAVKSYYGTVYAFEMLTGEENAVWSELRVGHYRIAVDVDGQIYERWVEVESGKLTKVVLIVK